MDLAALSTEYIYCDVKPEDTGGLDPTGNPVYFTFLDGDVTNSPGSGATWITGSWESGGGPLVWTARCLVGPTGAVTLHLGHTYGVWIKVSDAPETPIKPAGILTIV